MNESKATPEIPVILEGKQYTLTFGLKAYVELEKKLGENPWSERFWYNPGPSKIAAMFWAGLLKHHTLSLDEATDLVSSIEDLTIVGEAIQKAFANSQPKVNTEKKTKSKAPSK